MDRVSCQASHYWKGYRVWSFKWGKKKGKGKRDKGKKRKGKGFIYNLRTKKWTIAPIGINYSFMLKSWTGEEEEVGLIFFQRHTMDLRTSGIFNNNNSTELIINMNIIINVMNQVCIYFLLCVLFHPLFSNISEYLRHPYYKVLDIFPWTNTESGRRYTFDILLCNNWP